jgi:HKD family nuclease
MLHPKNDRIDYGEQLIPPPGYELSYAIGTTYSLDLEALMVLPVALFYSQNLDASPSEVRNDMLDAITQAVSKIAVFCQNGKIKVPKKYHHLMAYWEKGIHEITMPDYVNSFHPKVWVIRFEMKEKPVIYRVIVTSRNLSYVHDWDVAFSTEGEIKDIDNEENIPLVHFLEFLLHKAQLNIDSTFIQDLKRVRFNKPDKFEKLAFCPIGISVGSIKYENPMKSKKWDELLIITPFLDVTTLNHLHSIKSFLMSRKEEMDAIPVDSLKKYDCYQFSQFIEQAEFQEKISEDGMDAVYQNLHAKLYVGSDNKDFTWYLGSANFTDPAFGRNIEFMVELKGQDSHISRKNIYKQLTENLNENIPLFEPYKRSIQADDSSQSQPSQKLRKLSYELSKLIFKGKLKQREGVKMYDLFVEIDTTNLLSFEYFKVLINPVAEEKNKGLLIEPGKIQIIEFKNAYPETALSPFLKFEIMLDNIIQSTFLLRMDIELPDTRLNKIFTSIINSRDKFFRYLQFLLTGEENDIIKDMKPALVERKDGDLSSESWNIFGIPIYEKLLIAASRFPEKLKAVNNLIERIKNETGEDEEPIISQEFQQFWNNFIKYYETLQGDETGN